MNWLIVSILTVMTFSCSMRGSLRRHFSEVTVRIPWPSKDGQYSLQDVEIHKLHDLYFLNGNYARFVWAPAKDLNKMSGSAPHTNFLKSEENIYIPTDELTQQLATLYAHIERLVEFDRTAGAENINTLPIHVGVDTQLVKDGNLIYNNAFYDGETDALYFLPFKGKDLQLYINAGIIAHEYFHSLFYKIALMPLHSSGKQRLFIMPDSEENQSPAKTLTIDEPKVENPVDNYYGPVLVRGINEGLADFWAFLYTQDPDFLGRSGEKDPDSTLAREAKNRSLTGPFDSSRGFLDSQYIESKIELLLSSHLEKPSELLLGLSYHLGTHYARALRFVADNLRKEIYNNDPSQVNPIIAKALILTLKDFPNELSQFGLKDRFVPSLILFRLAEKIPKLGKTNCQFLEDLSKQNNDILTKLPQNVKPVESIKFNCQEEVSKPPDDKSSQEPI